MLRVHSGVQAVTCWERISDQRSKTKKPTTQKVQSTLDTSLSRFPVLVRVFVAKKKHHDHGNSYKGKHFIEGARLQFQRFSPLSSWQGACQHADRCGAGHM